MLNGEKQIPNIKTTHRHCENGLGSGVSKIGYKRRPSKYQIQEYKS